MESKGNSFDKQHVLQELRHYLPAQAPLKDFVHHNTLHAFQGLNFFEALLESSTIFGYKTALSLKEFRTLFQQRKISRRILERIIIDKKGDSQALIWSNKVHHAQYEETQCPRIGALRNTWKEAYKIDLDSMVHPVLFRILCSYLDQGISIWNFPGEKKSLLDALRELEKNSFTSFFRTQRARALLLDESVTLELLLGLLVGDESLFEQYIFDQQFEHPGWSGMVSTIETNPSTLLDSRNCSLADLIFFECLLEIDVLDNHFGEIWAPISEKMISRPTALFAPVAKTELSDVLQIWQEAYEWTFYDQVLAGISSAKPSDEKIDKSFQAFFCIDDRECSIRRYVEATDERAETVGTPGHFNLDFYFQPEHGKFHTKVCPMPVQPKFLIKETNKASKLKTDVHFNQKTHGLLVGWVLTHTFGFWSALRLFLSVFRPSDSPSAVSAAKHMDKNSILSYENQAENDREGDLQIGYTIPEMTDRLEGLLRSTGIVDHFAPLVYFVGHGASSVNNTHYAGYDCGACSGRPGSVNARVISAIANNPEVRRLLATRGIVIPETTQFCGALHDTSKDEILFYDIEVLDSSHRIAHEKNVATFVKALDLNAQERSRRFMNIDSSMEASKVHQLVKKRTVSLFEPRPELNHATNAICVIGRRELTKAISLDRRSFLNSYDYRIDLDGKLLLGILNAAAPVCGGINLEYYFSRVDNQKLGAGTKLPHNVMGLIGVANGIDGDLRTGLPNQMIEVHDPIRMFIVVEHFPSAVLETIQRNASTYEWFKNEWLKLVVRHPESGAFYVFSDGKFNHYTGFETTVPCLDDVREIPTLGAENLPIYSIKTA
ncbi:MAG: DUF2309 domain-containing protein [Crocinitomicaceae bacterium]|nr:MAG: DUF2309 domain-containing protein [Crocinitomicaceae bacterium]